MKKMLVCAALVAALGAGCSPANFAGQYTIDVINGANGCGFSPWNVGDTARGVGLTITQTPDQISGKVGGLTGVFLNLTLGSDTFTGTGAGNQITLVLTGSRAMSNKTCAYTTNATARASLTGEALAGTIVYTNSTNKSADCGTLTDCSTTQSFSGLRTAAQ